MIKLNWVSNENDTGSFLQIRNVDDKQYFITRDRKNDSDYTLTIVDENVKRFYSSVELAKQYAEKHYTEWYLTKK